MAEAAGGGVLSPRTVQFAHTVLRKTPCPAPYEKNWSPANVAKRALISLTAPTAELAGQTDGHMSGQPFSERPGRFTATGLLPVVTAVRIVAGFTRSMTTG
jgi:hypothetical protein